MAIPDQIQVGEAGVAIFFKPNFPPTPETDAFTFLGAALTVVGISPITGTRKVFDAIVTNDPDTGEGGQAGQYVSAEDDLNEAGPWALQVWADFSVDHDGTGVQKSSVYMLVVGPSL